MQTANHQPIDNGGPAFPIFCDPVTSRGGHAGWGGMSMRVYLAGQAITGLLSSTSDAGARVFYQQEGKARGLSSIPDVFAALSLECADALIARIREEQARNV
jgi:hypothetical protein